MSSVAYKMKTTVAFRKRLCYTILKGRVGVRRVKTRVVELMARKQLEVNVPIDATALVEGTKLSRPTIAKWIKGRVHSFDEKTILAFCDYFNCDIGDLLTIVEENGNVSKS